MLADIDEPSAIVAAEDIARTGGRVTVVPTDVTDAESVRALIDGVVSDFGRIDYLFNNAGTVVMGEIRDLDLAHWRHVINVNLFREIHGIHYAYPVMIRQGFGHIINTASGFGMSPGPLNSPYVASKFALVGISHALACEAKAFGVDVTVVCPGYIQTALIDELKPVNADAKDLIAQIPVKLVPVDRAAEIVLAGVARKKQVIAFPGYVSVPTFLYRFLPGLFTLLGRQQVADFRKVRKAPEGKVAGCVKQRVPADPMRGDVIALALFRLEEKRRHEQAKIDEHNAKLSGKAPKVEEDV